MPRSADYDNGVQRSDNAIEPGHNLTHGAGSEVYSAVFASDSFCALCCKNRPFSFTLLTTLTDYKQPTSEAVDHSGKAAPLPEGTSEMEIHHWYSGQGSRVRPESGSGKGGHEPKTLGEQKGLGGEESSKKGEELKES